MRAALLRFVAFVVLAASAFVARADEPRAQFRLDGGAPHVDIPFELQMQVEGFDEAPAPDQPPLVIAGATVVPLGATPNVARSIQIFNGRRSDVVDVTWAFRWRVEVHKPGRIRVPATTVTQGSKSATAQAGEVDVESVPTADDMALELSLPARTVFVGESFPVQLTWRFRRQPSDPRFSVPMAASDAFTVSAPAADNPRRTVTLPAGGKDLQLAYTMDTTNVGGVDFNRLVATFYAAPRRAGRVEIAPSSVLAALAVGRPDFFGEAPTKLFRVSDVARALDVKALPESGRPSTFSGAVGDQYAIAVRASRSVVQLGEPVELEVTIKSDQPLDTLALGNLEGEGRLPKDKFTVPADPPTGEMSDDGKTKTFRITALVGGPATEIPAIAFSYFDVAKGAYQTIRSDPISLSVKGGTYVGAADVVSAKPATATRAATPAAGDASFDATALVGADLALSSESATNDAPLSGGLLWTLVGLLHAAPIAVFVALAWRARTRGAREEKAEVRAARRRVEELIASAETRPARDVAGPLASALRDLARTTGRAEDDAGLLARLETESFAPAAAAEPLSAKLREDAQALLARWSRAAAGGPGRTTAVAALFLAVAASAAWASPLDDGRAAYQEAMASAAGATARRSAFARAEIALGDAARAAPDRPELLADWGNAALGAGDVATATLAYRRALAVDGGNARARHNLAWLRGRQPDAFRPASASAADTLLFFHAWPRPRRLLLGSAAFALAVLLVVPWSGRRRRALVVPALLPAAVWLAMIGSALLEDRHDDDAVVMDDVVLRAADSPGAPAAMSQPLSRGVEVAVLERRGAWTQVRVADGATGWIPGGAAESVSR
jgi:hypothetical protein